MRGEGWGGEGASAAGTGGVRRRVTEMQMEGCRDGSKSHSCLVAVTACVFRGPTWPARGKALPTLSPFVPVPLTTPTVHTSKAGKVWREAWSHSWSVAEPKPTPLTHLEGSQGQRRGPGGAAGGSLFQCWFMGGIAGRGVQSRDLTPSPRGSPGSRDPPGCACAPAGQAGFPGPEVPGQEPPAHTPAAGAAQTRGGRPPALQDGAQHGGRRGAGRVRGHLPGAGAPGGRFPWTELSLFRVGCGHVTHPCPCLTCTALPSLPPSLRLLAPLETQPAPLLGTGTRARAGSPSPCGAHSTPQEIDTHTATWAQCHAGTTLRAPCWHRVPWDPGTCCFLWQVSGLPFSLLSTLQAQF